MKLLKRIGKVIIVLIVVLLVAHTAATIVLGYMVKTKIAAIKAKGDPVSLADLNKERIPDSENAAVIYGPLFENVMAFWNDTNVLNSSEWIKQGRANPELWKQAGQAVARGQSIIDGVEAATSLPRCRFPVRLGPDVRLIFENYAGLRRLSLLLSANAKYHAASGNMDEAMRSIGLGFKLGESLKDDPLTVGCLVRVALVVIPSRALQKSLEYGNISESQSRQLFDLLADVDLYSGFEKMVIGDRAVGIYSRERIRREGFPQISDGTPNGPAVLRVPLRYRLLGTYIGRPFLYAMELDFLREMDDQIKIARLPYREARYEEPKPDSASVYFIDVPRTFDRLRRKRDSAMTYVAGSQILLALAAHRDRFGAYPETLAELKSELGWKLPKDPFSGGDFVYKREGNGYLLYSIGANLKDDGGTDRQVRCNESHEMADIIWRKG